MDIPKIFELRQKAKQSPNKPEPLLELANLYISAGHLKEGMEYLEKVFQLVPNHSDLATSLGAVAIKLDDKEKAQYYFEKAAELEPNSAVHHHNLGLLYSSLEKHELAENSFRRIIEIDPDNAQAHNDLAVILSYQGKSPEAKKHFIRAIELNQFFDKALSNYLEFCLQQKEFRDGLKAAGKYLEFNPNDQVIRLWQSRFEELAAGPKEDVNIRNVVDNLRRRPKRSIRFKIAFFDSQNAFGKDIMTHLSHCHDVKMFNGNSIEEIKRLLEWADLAWFEWCDQLLIEAARLPKLCPIICRLHSYEAFTIMPDQVDWSKVDKLILVNPSVDRILTTLHPQANADRIIIPNGVDTGKFTIPGCKTFGKNICSAGYINYKKDPLLMLQCFKAIYDQDPECRFFVAGNYQDPRFKFYFDHMIPKLGIHIQFDGWITDMPSYFKDMDFIISTSVFESFHYSLAEGMSSGLIPLVHNWPGSENIYPQKYRFNTVQECANLVQSFMNEDRAKLAQENRLFIIENFSLKSQMQAIDQLLEEIDPAPRSSHILSKHNRLHPQFIAKSDVDYGRVSIIIPTYNRGDYLEEAIESALKQTYKNLEIIVVDDGSTDNTGQILEKYKDKLKVIRQQNMGVSAALNNGIMASSGEYISWLSSDDAYLPEKIETTAKQLHNDPELGMVYSDYYYIDENSNVIKQANIDAPPSDQLKVALFLRNPINGNSVTFRRKVLKKTGYFDEGLGGKSGHTADGAMWHKIAHFYKVKFIPKPLVYYRIHSSNVSKSVDMEKNWQIYRRYMKRWFDELDKAETMVEGQAPFKKMTIPQKKGLNIVWIGNGDPIGISAMYKAAIERYTPHKCELITHFDRLNKYARQADIYILDADMFSGSPEKESRFCDPEELKFGSFDLRPYIKDKKCAAFLLNTISLQRGYRYYCELFQKMGWPAITCRPDIYRNIPDSHYVPILINRDLCLRVEPNINNGIVVVKAFSERNRENTDMYDRIRVKISGKHPNVKFFMSENPGRFDAMYVEAAANIGLDLIRIGKGHYGIASIVHSFLGLVNVVHLDDFARSLIARTIGTRELPWHSPVDECELYEILDSLLADPKQVLAEQNRTFAWAEKWWHEKYLIRHLTEFLERL